MSSYSELDNSRQSSSEGMSHFMISLIHFSQNNWLSR